MKLPTVSIDILGPIIEELDRPRWVEDMVTRLSESQPVLVEYLAEQPTEDAKLVGLLIIRFLESQCEADEMTELFQ